MFEEAKQASVFIREIFGHQVQQYPNSMTKYTMINDLQSLLLGVK